jgi:hypothetical protein
VVQKPDGGVLIVLLEGHGEAVGHIHLPLVGVAQQHAHDALLGVAGDAVIVVHDAEQHQGVQHDLFRHPHGCGSAAAAPAARLLCLRRDPGPRRGVRSLGARRTLLMQPRGAGELGGRVRSAAAFNVWGIGGRRAGQEAAAAAGAAPAPPARSALAAAARPLGRGWGAGAGAGAGAAAPALPHGCCPSRAEPRSPRRGRRKAPVSTLVKR